MFKWGMYLLYNTQKLMSQTLMIIMHKECANEGSMDFWTIDGRERVLNNCQVIISEFYSYILYIQISRYLLLRTCIIYSVYIYILYVIPTMTRTREITLVDDNSRKSYTIPNHQKIRSAWT